jgi:hypothetical protein
LFQNLPDLDPDDTDNTKNVAESHLDTDTSMDLMGTRFPPNLIRCKIGTTETYKKKITEIFSIKGMDAR